MIKFVIGKPDKIFILSTTNCEFKINIAVWLYTTYKNCVNVYITNITCILVSTSFQKVSEHAQIIVRGGSCERFLVVVLQCLRDHNQMCAYDWDIVYKLQSVVNHAVCCCSIVI